MTENYTFSAYVREIETKTIEPNWWQFWRKPLTVEGEVWVRKYVFLTEQEADVLLEAQKRNSPVWCLFLKAFAGQRNVWGLQVEQIAPNQPYMKTESVVKTS